MPQQNTSKADQEISGRAHSDKMCTVVRNNYMKKLIANFYANFIHQTLHWWSLSVLVTGEVILNTYKYVHTCISLQQKYTVPRVSY